MKFNQFAQQVRVFKNDQSKSKSHHYYGSVIYVFFVADLFCQAAFHFDDLQQRLLFGALLRLPRI